MARKTTGIRKLHSKQCPAKEGGRCRCSAGWQANVYSPKDGKRIYKTFQREAEARSWRADAKRSLDLGVLRAPGQVTLREAAEDWLTGIESGIIRNRSGQRFKPSTVRGYRQALEDSILPEIGGEKLAAVTTADLQFLVDRWQAESLPASTIRNRIKPLQGIYRRARSRSGLPVNPTRDLELPAPRPKEVEIVSPEVAARLLDTAPDKPIWATALYAGLRYGELRALRWGAVDLAGGKIHVRESWDPKEGEIEPKTLTSKRTVPVPGVLREILLDHRLVAAEPTDDALVFDRGDGRPFDAAVIYRRADKAWRRAELSSLDRAELERLAGRAGAADTAEAEDADLIAVVMRDKALCQPEQRLRLHQARHTYASFMIAANVNAKALSTYMGHSSIKVTFDLYGHLMPGNESEAAALLDAYLERANTQARIDALDGERP